MDRPDLAKELRWRLLLRDEGRLPAAGRELGDPVHGVPSVLFLGFRKTLRSQARAGTSMML